MSISAPHFTPPDRFFDLSGPALLRKHYFPRQRLKVQETAEILGVTRQRLRIWRNAGKLGFPVRHDGLGQPFVMLEDLIQYLYPSIPPLENTEPEPPPEKKKRGRPRKAITSYGGKGGVR